MRFRRSKRALERELLMKEVVGGDTTDGGITGSPSCGDGSANSQKDTTVVTFVEKEEVGLAKEGQPQQDDGCVGDLVFPKDGSTRPMEGMIWIWLGDDPPTVAISSLLPPSGFQIHAELGEIFDSCIWPPRIQGHLSHRYGVLTTLYGVVNHWHLEAWEIGGKDHQAAFNSSSPTSYLPTFIDKENKIVIQNVTGFCTCAEACSFHAISMETFCRTGRKSF